MPHSVCLQSKICDTTEDYTHIHAHIILNFGCWRAKYIQHSLPSSVHIIRKMEMWGISDKNKKDTTSIIRCLFVPHKQDFHSQYSIVSARRDATKWQEKYSFMQIIPIPCLMEPRGSVLPKSSPVIHNLRRINPPSLLLPVSPPSTTC